MLSESLANEVSPHSQAKLKNAAKKYCKNRVLNNHLSCEVSQIEDIKDLLERYLSTKYPFNISFQSLCEAQLFVNIKDQDP